MNLSESSILVAFTQRIREGQRQGISIASKLLIDYLIPRTHILMVVDQPIKTDPDLHPIHSLYIDGELNHTNDSYWASKKFLKLSDMIATYDSGRYSGYHFDLFIAGEQLNALTGWLLGDRVKKMAYVPADVSDHGLLHRFAKWRSDYVLPLTVSFCPPIQEENFKPRTEPVIGYLGALEERFGVDKLIEAVPLIQKAVPDVRVEIVGSGPQKQELEKKAEGLPITFRGFLPDAQAIEVMKMVKVGVAPYNDSFPAIYSGKIIFYSWCGVPSVVSTNTPREVEMVEKFHAGIGANPEVMGDSIQTLLLDDSTYRQYQDGCKALAQAYDATAYFDKMFQEV